MAHHIVETVDIDVRSGCIRWSVPFVDDVENVNHEQDLDLEGGEGI